jgi:hypothetical protein
MDEHRGVPRRLFMSWFLFDIFTDTPVSNATWDLPAA